MNEKQFKECSVVAYPHEIIFLHIKGGRISYYVDRHVSDYVNKLQQENEKLKQQLEQRDNIINKAREYIKTHQRKDEFLDLNEWQTRDLLEILNIDKGE